MRTGLRTMSILGILLGFWWILQGTGLAPVGFMANQMVWAYRGMVLIILGGAILFLTRRKLSH